MKHSNHFIEYNIVLSLFWLSCDLHNRKPLSTVLLYIAIIVQRNNIVTKHFIENNSIVNVDTSLVITVSSRQL